MTNNATPKTAVVTYIAADKAESELQASIAEDAATLLKTTGLTIAGLKRLMNSEAGK